MSCLFNSLEYFLQIPSKEIREKICDYLDNNNVIFDGIETKELLLMESDNYINEMRKTSTWGGAIEIKAACNIWNLEIIVYNIRNMYQIDTNKNNSQIQFIPNGEINNSIKKIYLTWNGFHYEPVKDNLKKIEINKNNNLHNQNKLDKIIKNRHQFKNKKNKKYKNKSKGLFDILFGSDNSDSKNNLSKSKRIIKKSKNKK